MNTQSAKADEFRRQHVAGKLLMLPNIWDVGGARLMKELGYPSVATASVATAITNGYRDGEQIPFDKLMLLVSAITSAVDIPLTVDMEKGFAENLTDLKDNIRRLIAAGAVGLNIEDSLHDRSGYYPLNAQCHKIEAIREIGIQEGVPLVINARTDFFALKTDPDPLGKSIERGKAYKSAGADCIYPILISDYEEIRRFVQAVDMPVNVNLLKPVADLKRLENDGVARVSVGPQLLYHVLTTMKQIGEQLRQYDTTDFFGRNLVTRDFIDRLT